MEQKGLEDIWRQILEKLRENIAENACQRWLAPILPESMTDTEFTLATPNQFHKAYVEERYILFIQEAAESITGKKLEIRLTNPEKEEKKFSPEEVPQAKGQNATEDHSAQPSLFSFTNGDSHEKKGFSDTSLTPLAPGDASSLNPRYTFDKFVTGNSNRFAHAAALAVSESPGTVYNPLFMYGGVGLGKTHLMHAIGNQILQNNPKMRVLYISSEKFTNEFINSIVNGNPEAFRQKYRTIDVLLVDDIQFLYKKEQTQEEFFHTFNALFDAKKAIILSSDRHPRAIQTLEDRLRSRFEWGLITDIQAPDLETRIAILKKKAIIENLDVPNDVLYYIASRIDNNIRELEGALTRVVAYASLNGQKISQEIVTEAMKNVYPDQKTRMITTDLIMEIVSSYFHLEAGSFQSKKRTRELAFPRQIAMYLCRELTDDSLPKIGEHFGGRDHTTVMHACKTISQQRKGNSNTDKTIKELIDRIQTAK